MALTAGKLYRLVLVDHWPSYAAGVAVLLVTSGTEVLVPRFIQWAIDLISGAPLAFLPSLFQRGDAGEALKAIVLWMVVALLVGWLGRFGWRQLLARQTHRQGRELKVRFWRVLSWLPLKYFHEYTLGELMNRATGDWNASRAIHGFTLVLTFDLLFFATLSIASMVSIDFELTCYCLAILPFLPHWILKLARKEHDQHRYAQEQLGRLSETVSEALGAIRLARATESDGPWQKRLTAESREYALRRLQVVKTGWKVFPLGAAPTLIAYAILLYLGVDKIAAGTLTVGQFVALQSYVLMLQGPLFDMGDCIAEWQRGMASLGRLVEIFNLERLTERHRSKTLAPPLPSGGEPLLVIKNLTYAYRQGLKPVLHDVSLTIHMHETVGILGPIGAGKTTLLSLIAGLLEPPAGQVALAGFDAANLAPIWLARHVTMVPQRAFLFAGTIRYNLELDAKFSDDELWQVLDLTRLLGEVRAMPEGLNTVLGEAGINLSGGQRQRLALARALLRRRDLILLDDCLSAVDAVTEEEVLNGLKAQFKDATVIWVAHRLSTLKLCSRVYRMSAGKLSPLMAAPAQPSLELLEPSAKARELWDGGAP